MSFYLRSDCSLPYFDEYTVKAITKTKTEGKETGHSDKHEVRETFRLRINDGGNCLALKNAQSNPRRTTVHNRSQHAVIPK